MPPIGECKSANQTESLSVDSRLTVHSQYVGTDSGRRGNTHSRCVLVSLPRKHLCCETRPGQHWGGTIENDSLPRHADCKDMMW